MFKKINRLFLVALLAIGSLLFVSVDKVSAQFTFSCPDGTSRTTSIRLSDEDRRAVCQSGQSDDQDSTTGEPETLAPGCYVGAGGTRTSSNCPANIENFDSNACYFAEGGSSGITDYEQGPCSSTPPVTPTSSLNSDCTDLNDCRILGYLRDFINILSAAAGIIIVIMIAYSGVRFSMSRDNAQEVAQWKNRILQALIALVFYLFTFTLLQWLVPGGIF